MECSSNCYNGDIIRISRCEDDPTRWKFIYHNDDDTIQIKVHDQNMCLEANDDFEDVRVTTCSSDEQQRFVSTPDGAFKSGPRFEIHPMHKPDRCLAPDHHPKSGEDIFQQYCDVAHEATASNWNKYYG